MNTYTYLLNIKGKVYIIAKHTTDSDTAYQELKTLQHKHAPYEVIMVKERW